MIIIADTLALICYAAFLFKSLIILQSARVLSGFIAGLGQAIGQITAKELLSRRLVGIGGFLACAIVVCNVLLVFTMSLLLPESAFVKYWRGFLVLPFPVTLIRLICFVSLGFDTPKYYFVSEPGESHARMKAERVVSIIFKDNYVDAKLQEIEDIYSQEKRTGVSITALLTNQSYRKRMLTAMAVNASQQFSGINFLMYYSTDLFNKINHNGKVVTFQMGVVKVVCAFTAICFINKLGRRLLLSMGLLVQGLSFMSFYILMKIELKNLLIIPIAFYTGAFAAGIGPLGMIYTTDILPPKAVGIGLSVQWFFDGVISKSMPSCLDRYGPDSLFIFFGICCFLAFIFIRMYCLESFGKSDLVIAKEFRQLSWKGIFFTRFEGVQSQHVRDADESVRGDLGDGGSRVNANQSFELMDDQRTGQRGDGTGEIRGDGR